MSIDRLTEWFYSLPFFAQIFFVLFLFLMALPIATLTILQFIESLRSLGAASKPGKDDQGKEKD